MKARRSLENRIHHSRAIYESVKLKRTKRDSQSEIKNFKAVKFKQSTKRSSKFLLINLLKTTGNRTPTRSNNKEYNTEQCKLRSKL